VNLLCISKKSIGFGVALFQVEAEHLIHPVSIRGGTIELRELGGLQVPVNVKVGLWHREGLYTHSGRSGDTLRELNFELGVDAVMVFL